MVEVGAVSTAPKFRLLYQLPCPLHLLRFFIPLLDTQALAKKIIASNRLAKRMDFFIIKKEIGQGLKKGVFKKDKNSAKPIVFNP